MRRLSTLPAMLLAATLAVSGCVPAQPRYTPTDPPPVNRAGPPFPAGSTLQPASAEAPKPISDEEPLGSLAPDDATAEERIPDIVQRGRIIVGVDQSQYLLSFRDPITGHLQGFEVDLAREISQDIFGNPNQVDFRFVDSSDRAAALQEGRVDIVIRTMSITRPRQDIVAFSAPYLSANMRLLVSQGSPVHSLEAVGHGTLCVANGSTAVDIARIGAPDATFLITSKWSDCLLALQQFQVDAVLADDTILSGMAAQDPTTDMVSLPLHKQSYGIGAALGNDNLIRQINATLERIRRDGTWWAMYNRWFGEYLTTYGPPLPHYREEDPS